MRGPFARNRSSLEVKALLATDGRKPSFQAERCVTALGNRHSLEITVLTVGDAEGRVMREPGEKAFDGSGLEASFIADAATRRLENEGFWVRSEVRSGTPHEEIPGAIHDGHYELTFLGARPSVADPARPMCPLASTILKTSTSAVLFARAGIDAPATILFLQDGSTAAIRALQVFLAFADPERCTLNVAEVRRTHWKERGQSCMDLIASNGFELKESLSFLNRSQAAEFLNREQYSVIVCRTEPIRLVKPLRLAPFIEEVSRAATAVFTSAPGV
jgi:nucleotide-binding universal stress UspA family protein